VIRPAQPADRAAVEMIVRAAYSPYVARIGKPPGPMLDDYARLSGYTEIRLYTHTKMTDISLS
jgi:hypothetical protein